MEQVADLTRLVIRAVTSVHATLARERKLVRCRALDTKKGKEGYSFHSGSHTLHT